MSKFKEYISFSNKFSWTITKYIAIVVTIGASIDFWNAYQEVGFNIMFERLITFYSIFIPLCYALFFFIGLGKFHIEYGFKNKTWDEDGFL